MKNKKSDGESQNTDPDPVTLKEAIAGGVYRTCAGCGNQILSGSATCPFCGQPKRTDINRK